MSIQGLLAAAIAAVTIAAPATVENSLEQPAPALTGHAATAAKSYNPYAIGPPYFIKVTSTTQKAILSGYAATPAALICLTTAGSACPVSAAITAFITPYVVDHGVCPNNGIRRLEIRNYMPPARPGEASNSMTYSVKSNVCVAR